MKFIALNLFQKFLVILALSITGLAGRLYPVQSGYIDTGGIGNKTGGIGNNTDDQLYFKNLYFSRFKSPDEADAEISKSDDFNTLLDYANFYYTTGALMKPGNSTGVAYIQKAFMVYQILWKQNFSNPRIQVLMANAYASQGANPQNNIKTIIEYVFRARNLYSMVIDRYSSNLEARLGRARINMNLTPATGRPDEIHREDIRIFIAGYQNLPHEEKENLYYKMGLMEMYLARAMLAVEKKNTSQAQADLNRIDTALLHEQAKKLYDTSFKTLKKTNGDKND
jgi:hypothetical protein